MKKAVLILACALMLASCGNKRVKLASSDTLATETQITGDNHNAKNSLSYYGVYEGTLPCSSCEGKKTKLTINKDNTFSYEYEHIGECHNRHVETTGIISWNEEGNTIILGSVVKNNVPLSLFVGESKVIVLNDDGSKREGDDATKYTMIQTKNE